MRNLLIAAVAAIALACAPACVGPVDWPKVAQCGAAGDALFPIVAKILTEDGNAEKMGESAIAQLEKLARERSPSIVACVIEQLGKDWLSPSASPDPVRIAGARRGQDFLRSKGVERVE